MALPCPVAAAATGRHHFAEPALPGEPEPPGSAIYRDSCLATDADYFSRLPAFSTRSQYCSLSALYFHSIFVNARTRLS